MKKVSLITDAPTWLGENFDPSLVSSYLGSRREGNVTGGADVSGKNQVSSDV